MSGYRVPTVLWAVAALETVLALVASVADWPAQFAADGGSPDGAVQWLVEGSAVSAPLALLLLMIVTGALATRRGWIGVLGDLMALPLAAVNLVGALGESLAPDPVTAPRGVLVASGALGVVVAVIVVWAVAHDLRVRRAPKPVRH